MSKYITKYYLCKILIIVGFLLIAIPSIYVAASAHIIFGMLACGFFAMIAGVLIY